MPHLTPIRWITAIIITWTLISSINIIQWRNKPIKFTKLNNTPKRKLIKYNWSW